MSKDQPIEDGYVPEGDYLQIANEFAVALVRKVKTRNGERLEISSPKLGFKTYLDPIQLESLTWCSKQMFHRLLKDPWGPSESSD
jgi:hypothetical protein